VEVKLRTEQENPLQRIVTRCWDDEAFKERLLADPAATLAAEGVKVPEGMTVNVAVDSETVRTLVIPLPRAGALGDGELFAMSGGAGTIGMLRPRSDDPLWRVVAGWFQAPAEDIPVGR